jgi:UDP-3-O-[3-hydroxymyristoyl] glucosamine N-acyltransferase
MNNKTTNNLDNSAIVFLDCSENVKIVVSHEASNVFISAHDTKNQQHGFIAFQMKPPYAKDYQRLAQALQSVSRIIEEQLEIRES